MTSAQSLQAKALYVFIALWLLHPEAGARAGTITFNDLSDNVTVVDTTGRITSSACTTTTAVESCHVTFSAPLNTVSTSGSPISLNVRESVLGPISDVLIFSFSSSGGTIDFVSDVEGGAVLDPVPGPFVVETGTVQDAGTSRGHSPTAAPLLIQSHLFQMFRRFRNLPRSHCSARAF
jgi:hypothetical protein